MIRSFAGAPIEQSRMEKPTSIQILWLVFIRAVLSQTWHSGDTHCPRGLQSTISLGHADIDQNIYNQWWLEFQRSQSERDQLQWWWHWKNSAISLSLAPPPTTGKWRHLAASWRLHKAPKTFTHKLSENFHLSLSLSFSGWFCFLGKRKSFLSPSSFDILLLPNGMI